jgi:hypothetical protein
VQPQAIRRADENAGSLIGRFDAGHEDLNERGCHADKSPSERRATIFSLAKQGRALARAL